MPQGKVKWFNEGKGYGFIIPSDEKEGDVFVHLRDVIKSGLGPLESGQLVDYQVCVTERGKRSAKDIKFLSSEPNVEEEIP